MLNMTLARSPSSNLRRERDLRQVTLFSTTYMTITCGILLVLLLHDRKMVICRVRWHNLNYLYDRNIFKSTNEIFKSEVRFQLKGYIRSCILSKPNFKKEFERGYNELFLLVDELHSTAVIVSDRGNHIEG